MAIHGSRRLDPSDQRAPRVLGAAQQRCAARRRRNRLALGLRARVARARERADEGGESQGPRRLGDRARPAVVVRQGTTDTPGASNTPFWSTST
ncbi:MAG: hypothetical protein DCC71_22640 [Proteobacteria bacterium]|nr:MAG: hypothetical protein DCC71_22640 [Pseudomonadota bacterium]